MSKEGENSKLPFKDTQKAYRFAVETLVGGLLEDPVSSLLRTIAAAENSLREYPGTRDNRNLSDEHQKQSELIVIELKSKTQIPVAMPVDYKPKRGVPENQHNVTQVYLFGDQSMSEIGRLHGNLTYQRVEQQVRAGVKRVLKEVPQPGFSLETLNFRRPWTDRLKDRLSLSRGGIIINIREAISNGSGYDDLKKAGFETFQIMSARKQLAERQTPVEVPRDHNNWSPILEAISNPESDVLTTRELIDNLTRGIMQNHPEISVSLSEFVRRAGLYPRYQKGDMEVIFNYLDCLRLPVACRIEETKNGPQQGLRNYYFAVRRFEEKIIGELKNAKGERFNRMRIPPRVRNRIRSRVKILSDGNLS